jgi:hypothetical protein
MDGCYARKYKMTSKFGDYYDHIVDWIRNLALLLMIIYTCKCDGDIIPIIVIIVFFIMGNIKQAYQDKYYKIMTGRNETESLNFLQSIVNPPNDIKSIDKTFKILKYSGWGIFTVTCAVFLASCSDTKIDVKDIYETIKDKLGITKEITM